MAIFDDLPYRAHDVLIMEPNRAERGQFTFDRDIQDHDNKVSLPLRNDPAQLAFTLQKFSWLLENRAAKRDFYKFLYRVRGRQKIFWVPSWREDIEMVNDIAVGSAELTIRNVGFSAFGLDLKFKHLMFFLADGSYEYRQIDGAAYVDSATELLTFDRPFYTGLSKANVVTVSFISLSRLDNDVIEIRHKTDMDGIATSVTVFRSVWDIRDV